MTKPIKLGLAGIGRAGWGMHINELKDRGDKFEFAACCDVVPERLEQMKEKFESIKPYNSLEEMIKDDEIEVFDIATRSPEHVGHALMCLEAGKTVFLEKPIALKYSDACKLAEAAEKSDGKLYFRHNRRFEEAFQHIREIIASGKIGDAYEIRLHRHGYQRRNDWQTIIDCGGGQLNNWGPHIIDHALRFLDSPVKEIWSDLKKIAAVGDAEDHLKIILKGENDRIVDMEISGGVAYGQPHYVVYGTKGAITCFGNEIKVKFLDPFDELKDCEALSQTPPNEGSFGNAEKLQWIEQTLEASPKSGCSPDSIWDHLYEAIRNGIPFPITTEEALQVVEVAEKAKIGTTFEAK